MWANLALVLSFGLAVIATEYEGSRTTPQKLELPDVLFVPYTKYTYNYTVQALTNIPHESKTVTGMRISCKLDVTIEPDEETARSDLLRLRNCDISIVNKDQAKHYREHYVDSMPFIMLPADVFQPVDNIASVGESMKTHLHKPVAFQYIRGSIGEIKAYEDDPIWSVNIKKGILSVLKAFTTTRKDIDSMSESARIRESDKVRSEANDYLVYRVFEKDAIGDCESSYVWGSQPSPFSVPESSSKSEWLEDSATVLRVVNMTKSRNYGNCSRDPLLIQTTMPFDESPLFAEQGKSVLNSTAHIDYSIAIVASGVETGSTYPTGAGDGKPVVERIYARSQHVFAPFGYDHGYLSATTHQMLELASLSRFTELSQSTARLTKATTIEMEQPPLSELSEETSTANLATAKNKIQSLLVDLRESHMSGRREHAGCTLISLIDELKKLDFNGLKAVLEISSQLRGARNMPSAVVPEERLRHFLIDLLPTIGSRHSVRLMKELLKTEKTAERVLSLIPLLNFLMPPHPTVLPEVAKLCDAPEMKVLKSRCTKVAKLAYGSLVYNLFSDWRSVQSISMPTRVRTPRCTVATGNHAECGTAFVGASVVLKRWLSEGLQSKKENETIAALEAISNSGHPDVFDEIKKILEDTSAQLSVKVSAGYALRKMITTGKKDAVFRVLMPIMRDPSLDVELRIMAYTVLIETGFSESLMENLAHVMNGDRSTYLVNYMHNHLKSLSETNIPNLRNRATKLRTLLAGVRIPVSEYYPFGRQTHVPFYSDELKFGGSLNLASFSTPKSFLPRAVNVKLNAYLFGKRVNLLEIISRVEGLQPLLDKLVGPGPSKWTSVFSELDKEDPKRRGSVDFEEAESQSSTKKPSVAKPEPFVAHFMLKVFGKHVSFSFVNAHSVLRALFGKVDKRGREVEEPIDFMNIEQTLSNGIEASLHKNLLLVARASTPTLAGIPLYMNATFGIQIEAEKFKLTAGVEPALFSERSSDEERRENVEERQVPSRSTSEHTSDEAREESNSESEVEIEEASSDEQGQGRASRRAVVSASTIKKLKKFFVNWKSETLKRKLTLNVQGNPKIYAIAHAVLGFDLHEISTLSGIHADVLSDFSKETLSTEVHADVKNGLLTLSIDVPKAHHVALNATVAPFGFVTVPIDSAARSGKHVVHSTFAKNMLTDTFNKSVFHYYRRNEELNVTARATTTRCADGRSLWKALPTYAFCGKQAFELVLHGGRSAEKIQLSTTLSANVTFNKNGKIFRYPPSPSKSLIESDWVSTSTDVFGPSESNRYWSFSVGSSLQTRCNS